MLRWTDVRRGGAIASAAVQPAATPAPASDQKLPEAPIEMRLRWIFEVAEMGPDALELFEQQTIPAVGPREPRRGAAGDRRATSGARWMTDDRGVGPAPPETVALWVKRVASMGRDELDDFERRTFAAWDRASLGDWRIAIQRRRRELAR